MCAWRNKLKLKYRPVKEVLAIIISAQLAGIWLISPLLRTHTKLKVLLFFCFDRIGTLAIMIFNLSFGADVERLYLCEVRVPCEKNNNDITANHKEKISI